MAKRRSGNQPLLPIGLSDRETPGKADPKGSYSAIKTRNRQKLEDMLGKVSLSGSFGLGQTFCHMQGISKQKEAVLWAQGIQSWEKLETELKSGGRLLSLAWHKPSSQGELFTSPPYSISNQAETWLEEIAESKKALRSGDWGYFLSRLENADHWRVLATMPHKTLFLDLETTGLSHSTNYITLIGAFYQDKFYQWGWQEDLSKLWSLMKGAEVVVTFNGNRFDLPFLKRHFPSSPDPRSRVDLLHLTRAAGIKGGQKVAEMILGLTREESTAGLGGEEAVALWTRTVYGDRGAYNELVEYNRTDVTNMPLLAQRLCNLLHQKMLPHSAEIKVTEKHSAYTHGRRPPPFKRIRSEWSKRKRTAEPLLNAITRRYSSSPCVIGIDLRGNPNNPTGIAICHGMHTETRILHSDEEIVQCTLDAKPTLISIDAPLSLPRGRVSVSDDSPCRKVGGIVRAAERVLWARGIPVYPSLIRHMQGLTKRGIELTARFREASIPTIESYPGAAQDVLGIARKGVGIELLEEGLLEYGFQFKQGLSHDELDAITSALVGFHFLANDFESIGADDEGYMILPRRSSLSSWQERPSKAKEKIGISLVGMPGAGKTTLAWELSRQLSGKTILLGHELRLYGQKHRDIQTTLNKGQMAPEALVIDIMTKEISQSDAEYYLIDGFPRHPAQIATMDQLISHWVIVLIEITATQRQERINMRLQCKLCGWVGDKTKSHHACPVCNTWNLYSRTEDFEDVGIARITMLEEFQRKLLNHISEEQIIRLNRADQDSKTLARKVIEGLHQAKLL